jgi:acetoin utilization protein AcuC
MESVAIVYQESIKNYDFGRGHPFTGERFPNFIRLLNDSGLISQPNVSIVESKPVDNSILGLIHPESYISEVEKREAMFIPLSGDTPLRPGIVDAARYIVGSSVIAGELTLTGSVKVAEGVGGGLHHAGRNYGGGFCIFNDVAICAQNLLENHDLERVLILDSDVHAGNGTMDIFYEDSRVLFISVHQDPRTIYPGTGFIEQIGEGSGRGYTVNFPLPPKADDKCMDLFLEEIFKPIAKEFNPQIIIRNGGTDPHFLDGLGGLYLTFQGLQNIGKAVAEVALNTDCGVVDLCCSGYNPSTVANGWLSILSGVIGYEFTIRENNIPKPNASVYSETLEVLRNVKRELNDYWDLPSLN